MSGASPNLAADWRSLVRDVPDFPIPGILFKDIVPVLADPAGLAAMTAELTEAARAMQPDVVVAIEARGFILGAPIALALGIGFVPVRKPGKLPFTTRSVAYALEYGEAVLHMHTDALGEGARVVIVDDVLATGGTLEASAQLVTEAGAIAVGAVVALEIGGLGARERLARLPLTALQAV
ncbi:adenine phosphoribosyltransferase [Sporichthya sp.]|uniref:adenine phosphoribosyltransferase n=1 Tax=Sporichthya sp. TaxID=65475 RepID=UPI0025FF0E51|nr:adenine phosphoribosyltransferase [Sporichthya sp.]